MKAVKYDTSKMKIVNNILIEYYASESKVVLPEGIIGIAGYVFAFDNSSIENVSLPKTLLWIGNGAFKGCRNIKSLVLPDRLAEIDDEAFAECSGLNELIIPGSVYRIGKKAFSECTALKKVECCDGTVRIDGKAF